MDWTGLGPNCNNMSQTVVAQAAPIVTPTFGVIDPTTGHMMNPDDVAVHWKSAQTRKIPHWEGDHWDTHFLAKDFQEAHQEEKDHQEEDILIQDPEEELREEDQTHWWAIHLQCSQEYKAKAEHFLTQWKLYIGINISNPIMANFYQWSKLFLTCIQEEAVSEWVTSMSKWLQMQGLDQGACTNNKWLWDSCPVLFKHQFADTLQKEKARMTLWKGINMQGQDLDSYTVLPGLKNLYNTLTITWSVPKPLTCSPGDYQSLYMKPSTNTTNWRHSNNEGEWPWRGRCSGKALRYDKPSLKIGWTVKDVSATSARQRQVTPNYSVSLEGSASVCPLCKDQERVQTVRSRSGPKRTSWIVRATILGFIYTLEVLLSKLSRSVSSK